MAPSLLGRVPFGRVSSDPRMIVSQLLYLSSLFFLLLGASVTAVEMWSGFMRFGDPQAVMVAPPAAVPPSRRRRDFSPLSLSGSEEDSAAVASIRSGEQPPPLSEGTTTTIAATATGSYAQQQRYRLRRRESEARHEADAAATNGGSSGSSRQTNNNMAQAAAASVSKEGGSDNGNGDQQQQTKDKEGPNYEYGTYSPKRPTTTIGDGRKYLHANFYVGLDSLFIPTMIGESTTALAADAKFVFAHLITALLLCYPAALCIERRKFVTDFVSTLYVGYYIGAVFASGTLLQPFTFWVGTVAAMAVCAVGTGQIAYRREMAEVLISGEEMQPVGGQQSSQQQQQSGGVGISSAAASPLSLA